MDTTTLPSAKTIPMEMWVRICDLVEASPDMTLAIEVAERLEKIVEKGASAPGLRSRRSFYHSVVQLSRAWYAEPCLRNERSMFDEFNIMFTNEPTTKNGVLAEFSVQFFLNIGAQLQVVDEAMPYLMEHSKDLLEFLAKNPSGLTPERLRGALVEMGYTDATDEKS